MAPRPVRHAAKGSGKITRAQNPLTGQTVKHSAARWRQIAAQYQKQYGPEDITAPMSPFDVKTAIDAASRTKFQPQYQTIADQQRISGQQDTNISNWYADYRKQIADAAQRSNQATQAATNYATNFANSSSALDAAQRATMAAQQQVAADARGQQVDPNQGLVGQQADQSRRQNMGQFGTLQAAEGANTQQYFGDRGISATGQEIAGHQAENVRRQGLLTQKKTLQGQEGDYRTTLRGQLQQSERQNQLARATFGLNQAKAAAAAAPKPPTPTERLNAAKDKYQRQHHTGPYAPGGPKPETPAERRARQRDAAQRKNKTGPYAVPKPGGGKNKAATTFNQQFQNAFNYVFSVQVPLPKGGYRGLNYQYDFTGQGRNNLIAKVMQATHVPYNVAASAVDARGRQFRGK